MSIFLDANIIFSGSNGGSSMHRFLHWLHTKETLVTSAYAALEAERNILAKRTSWHDGYKDLMVYVQIVPEALLAAKVELADKDQPILGAAIAGACEFLVTGDKRDFGHLYNKSVEGVTIVDYVSLAKILLERHS